MNIQLEKKNVTDLQADLIVVEKGTLASAGQPDPAGRAFLEVSAPDWEEGKNGLIPKLSRRYQKGLDEALKKDLHTIGFPLLSAGAHGYPPEKAWRAALHACFIWQEKHPDHEMTILFAEPDDALLALGRKELEYQENQVRHKAAEEQINRSLQMGADLFRELLRIKGIKPPRS